MEISPIVLEAVKMMRKSFGGVEIEIISKEMVRSSPNQYAPVGNLGVTVSIYSGFRHHRLFLGYQLSEDMVFYGQHIADDVVGKVMLPDLLLLERKLKLDKINKL